MNINGFEVEKFNIHNIPENAKYHTCPECSADRKKSTDKCMSVFWDTGLGRCNHCGAQVQLHTYKKKNESSIRQYVKPTNVNTTNLDDRHVEWFESRGISQSTLRRAGISSGATYMPDGKGGYQKRMAIMFNYIKDGELTNIKYRDGDKNFKLVKDAERIFYNIDGIRTSKECIIAEGEIDALTYMEIGRWDVVSLPNGASLKTVNLEYLDSAISYFENKDIIYLALDNDEAGLNTQKELLRRLGADKCRLVDMRGYKDPNDILIAEGTRGVSLSIENAREVPIENVSSVGDWEDEYDYFLLNGMKQGYGIGKPYFDDVFTTYTGQFITVTGIPSCVTGDTEVLMEDGSYRQIKDVNKGDRIISISDEYKSESDVVSDKWSSGVKPVYEMELQSGKRLKATKEHRIMTLEGWKDLGDLRKDDLIACIDDVYFDSIIKGDDNIKWEQIFKIDYIGEVETYDIEVEKNHNFIANDIVVHNCGKSDFVDEMVIGYNRLHGWKVAYASPENKPNVIHASKIEAKLVGQWVRSEEQLKTNWHQRAKEHIHDNFKFIDLERFTLENVLSKAKEMIRRFGIKVLVIDPYNKIPLEGDKDSMSVSYTSEYLLKIDEFARNNDILIILVAHPRKPSFSDGKYIPTMYDIKGSGEFYDMSPHGLVVHRDFENEASMVKVLKCKFSFLGETGAQTWFKWNKNNGRFSEFGVHGSEIEECSYVEYNDTNEFADDDEVEPIAQQQSEDLPW